MADGEGAFDLVMGEVELLGDLLDSRLAAELLEQGRGPPADLVERAGAVERDAYDAALFRERLEYGLPDPPHGVGDELDALGLVEFPGGPDEAEVALIDEVAERDALVLVLLGDADDEPQVGANEFVEGFLAAGL